jgi:hypothetical protein
MQAGARGRKPGRGARGGFYTGPLGSGLSFCVEKPRQSRGDSAKFKIKDLTPRMGYLMNSISR